MYRSTSSLTRSRTQRFKKRASGFLRRVIVVVVIAVALVILNLPLEAAPLHPSAAEQATSSGAQQLQKSISSELWRDSSICAPELEPLRTPTMLTRQRSVGLNNTALSSALNSIDTIKILIILADFADNPYNAAVAPFVSRVSGTPAMFDSALFSTGHHNPSGSLTEYFLENSYGTFFIQGFVTRWYRMPRLYSAYVNGTDHGQGMGLNARDLAWDAVKAADADVHFADFDRFGPAGIPDGKIDGLIIVHAGTGHEETAFAPFDDIHSHKWTLRLPLTLDGVTMNAYAMTPEESYLNANLSAIGVSSHEFGHFLGLPDLYDIDATTSISVGLGNWSLMATGCYLGNSRFPAHLDAWSKSYIGFTSPSVLSENATDLAIPMAESSAVSYRLNCPGTGGLEYFLVENRQKQGFDAALPGAGLLIYHIDLTANAVGLGNINAARYLVALEQADGNNDLALTSGNRGDAGDPFATGFEFTDASSPASRANGGEVTQVGVWNISPSSGEMRANLDVSFSRPRLTIDNLTLSSGSELGYGRDAGASSVVAPGDFVTITARLRNDWATATNLTLSCATKRNNHDIAFVDSVASIASLAGGGAVSSDIRFTCKIADTLLARADSIIINAVADNMPPMRLAAAIELGSPQILLINADSNSAYQDKYETNLRALGRLYRTHCVATDGPISDAVTSPYRALIWYYGSASSQSPSATDISAMKSHIDRGGSLFLSGQSFAEQVSKTADSSFLADYLQIAYDTKAYAAMQNCDSAAQFAQNLPQVRFFGNGGAANWRWDLASSIIPISGAVPLTQGVVSGTMRCFSTVRYDRAKIVFFSAPFEAIQNTSEIYTKREEFLDRILDFFQADIMTKVGVATNGGIHPEDFRISQNYPNPFNPETALRFTIEVGAPPALTTLAVYNVLGQRVRTLLDTPLGEGGHQAIWDGRTDSGAAAASGVYFAVLTRSGLRQSVKMILLR